MTLFELASVQTGWLAARQAAVARNVASASIPGATARMVAPFADVLARAGLSGGADTAIPERATRQPVSLEQEMLRAGDVYRAFSLNTGIARSFHRMLMTTAKGGA